MRLIHELFSGVVAAKINDVRDQWRRRMVARGIVAFCALIAFGGLAFIAVGSYLSLSERMVPWKAGLIVGGGVLVLSVIGVLAAWLFVHRRKSQHAPNAAGIDGIARLGEAIGASIGKQGIRTADIVIVALIAGAVLGASSALRERLLRPGRCRSASSGSNPDRHSGSS